MKHPQIIAFGGSLLVPQENLALEKYVVEASKSTQAKVCFIGTASGDDAGYRVRFYETFAKLGCEAFHLSLFTRTPVDLRSLLLSCDIICVGGGNTRSMLALWREWGIDRILREAWEQGIILTGSSAGMICWFEQGLTDSLAGSLTPLNGLGFLPFSAAPHYDGEPERRPQFQQMIANKTLISGLAADNGVGLHFIGRELAHVITCKSAASAYRVQLIDEQLHEERLEATLLAPVCW